MQLDKTTRLKIIRISGVVLLLCLILIRLRRSSSIQLSNQEIYSKLVPEWFTQLFLNLRQLINQSLKKILPEPQYSLLKSLFFGGKGNLPFELKQQIRRVGLSHLVAVSGLHLTIISRIIARFLTFLALGNGVNFILNLIFILGFVIMADFSSSVIRAAFMSLIFLISKLTHRLSNSSYALILTVLIMVLINPSLLKQDLGFQLSVLATAGLIYLYPYLQQNKTNFLADTFSLNLSALIAVTPWVLYQTQFLSLVAPLSNLLITPLVPLIMSLGLIVAFCSLFFSNLAVFFGFYLNLLLKYFLVIVERLAQLPWAEIFFPVFPGWLVSLCYLTLILWLILKRHSSCY